MAKTAWQQCWTWGHQYAYPISGVRKDTIDYLTTDRMRMLIELYELLTGRKERAKAWKHRQAVWATRRARAAAWKEDCAYE